MPGMNSNLSPASPILVSAFRSALMHQLLIIGLILIVLLIAWGMTRTAIFGSVAGTPATDAVRPWREPRARTVLRVGFGIVWLFDGILQIQSQMPGSLADQVIQPAATGSPGWVQDLVNFGVNVWDYHPIQAAAATVWIQIGIGLWMLLAVRGRTARLAGLAGVAWGLIVWVFGEAFGGIFAPGLTVLFGAPGAALIYVVAGALLALPQQTWDDPRRIGRIVLGGTGVFFLGMALLQAWPGRGFWQGKVDGHFGSLTSMIASMSSTEEPGVVHTVIAGFGNFAVAHGFAVNLVAVIALAVIGAGLVAAAARANSRVALIAVIAGAVFCLADWVLVEDFGSFGGVGTDPNSMVPLILLFTAGLLALAPAPAPALAPAGAVSGPALLTAPVPDSADSPAGDAEPVAVPEPAGETRRGGRLPALARAFAGTPLRVIVGVGALGVVLVGAVPMAAASVNRTADPITAESIAGSVGVSDTPAANFTLTSQDGQQVSLSSLRGKVVLLTFLDPVCTTDCPLIAQEMKSAVATLGSKASDTEMVAVVANPTYTSIAYLKAFDAQENLSQVPNWLYLTGSVSQLTKVWEYYGVEVEDLPAGAMAAHDDLVVVIDAKGNVRQWINADPGPGTNASMASYSSLMADSVRSLMGQAS